MCVLLHQGLLETLEFPTQQPLLVHGLKAIDAMVSCYKKEMNDNETLIHIMTTKLTQKHKFYKNRISDGRSKGSRLKTLNNYVVLEMGDISRNPVIQAVKTVKTIHNLWNFTYKSLLS